MPQDFIQNIDVGPGRVHFDENYLGRTSGQTQFNYSLETEVLDTEEDGPIDEIITADGVTVTVPLFETDIDTLEKVIPWAIKENGVLHIPKAIGARLSEYAKKLTVTPIYGTGKIVIHKAYPKPGPIEFTLSRTGRRIAMVEFIAMQDHTKDPGKDYFQFEHAGNAVAIVTANPGSGTYGSAQDVVLSTTTEAATIHYTIDGSEPTEVSDEYTTPITINSPTHLRARAFKSDHRPSPISDFYYFGDLTP